MFGTELLVNEHKNIMRMALVMRKASINAMVNQSVNVDDFYQMIDFVRSYADKHHHQKEEQVLFMEMEKNLGDIGVKLIRHGMLVEHDFGRMYMMELDNALKAYSEKPDNESILDIITNTVAYTKLIERHIKKEDDVVYKFAEKNLSKEILKSVDERTRILEEEAAANNIQDKYISLLEELEKKYL